MDFREYMLASRREMMQALHRYDQEVAGLYRNLARRCVGELKAASTDVGRLHLQQTINAFHQAARDVTGEFENLLDTALHRGAGIQSQHFVSAMWDYWSALERGGVKVDTENMLRVIPTEAVSSIYRRAYEDGLFLSDRIWNLGKNTEKGLERIVTEGVARGLHYDDKRITEQLERFLQPSRMGKRVSPTITRTLKDGSPYTFQQRPVSFDAARLLRTEYANAYREAQHISAMMNPAAYGEEWLLSVEHPDIGCACEDYATHDEGLGEGVFRIENTPITSHPCCLCDQISVLVSMDEFMQWVDDYMNYDIGPIADWVEGPANPFISHEAALNYASRMTNLQKVEKSLEGRKTEKLVLLDTNGNTVLSKTTGHRNRVAGNLSGLDPYRNRELTITHNHPKGTSFSSNDLATACYLNSPEVRAAALQHRYSILRPQGGWDINYWMNEIEPARVYFDQMVHQEQWNLIDQGLLTPTMASFRHQDLVWQKVAEELGLIYTKTGI